MLTRLPKEKRWVSWLYVALWSAAIFLTIPLARSIQQFVRRKWGSEWFGYLVIAIALILLIATIIYLIRRRLPSIFNYVWLVAVCAVVIKYTVVLMEKSPEEAFHFVQYGLLGLLIFRASSHRIRDCSIYFTVTLIGGSIGIIDEVIQWITPKRYWDLYDIWLNFLGTSLSQVALAMGLSPTIISEKVNWRTLRHSSRMLGLGVVLLGLCMLNTPVRIDRYSERIPFLKFLKTNESVMLEYGYFYTDPDVGVFRSRLSPEELSRSDVERAEEAAMVLDQFRSDSLYSEFLKIYTPVSDPFLHEARVHLFRRDRHLEESREFLDDEERYRDFLTTSYRENHLVEKYFTNTLNSSSYVMGPEQVSFLESEFFPDVIYDSAVSKNLVTSVNETQVKAVFILVLIGFVLLDRYFSGKLKDG
jgi:hypothetical protein